MKSQKNISIAIILSIIVVALFLSMGFFGIRSFGAQASVPLPGSQAILEELSATGTVADLRVFDVVEGEGSVAEVGHIVVVHYTGVLPDGTVFDSSVARGEPFTFQLGTGGVIQGWELGILGMKTGGRRLLVIPPQLAYGNQSLGSIPANATLIFEVELLQVVPTASDGADKI